MNDFVHLHVHSEYSLLDGYAATSAIVARAAELGMDSIALTDHGVMYGAIEFAAAARKAGVKPIIGVEAYIAPGSRADAMSRGTKNYHHLLLLAQNATGYRNLVKLTTRAHLEGMGRGIFARPRIDRELLEQHHDGLIVTSSCIAGEVIQALQDDRADEARRIAAWYRDLLGPERYFLELQLHDNTPELETINDELVRIGKELGIPLVVTSDTHFVRREDLEAQKMIMAMGMGMSYTEFCGKSYAMDETYHIASGDEMWRRFRRYGTAALEHTRRIADQCDVSFDFGRVKLPEFAIPAGHDAASYLRFICEEGLMRRCNGAPPETYIARLAYELDVINRTGFPDYMLIVWDYVRYARGRGIPCVPRGSAGASLVLYALEITDVDPLANKLLFERFLSPERLEMPDIDIDFADSRRGEVLDYIASKYGRENTAQIITYGTLGARAALKDMGRVLEIPISDVERVTRLIPTQPVGTTLGKALETVTELRELYEQNPDARRLIDWARRVEGRMRSVGTHACGVVISRAPLDQLVPLQRTTKDEQAVMAAYEGPTLAKIGLLKMDILGLTNLSVVAEALDYIAQTTGRRIELKDIPLDDRAVFDALGRGETTNVFQLESPGMTKYLKELRPTRVDDLYAMVALYRPGPLDEIPTYIRNKNNPRGISYLHPILKPILSDTYGVIVYQEQIMQILREVAEYTLGQAYIVIKAISKKDHQLMAENEARFKEGSLRRGLTREQADQLWELILPFAGYSFNRPHATLYGMLSYQTAWLKVNYPVEYMAAVLKGAGGVTEDIAKAINECRMRGVAVLGPDINASALDFTITRYREHATDRVQPAIRFGLKAIKNVGESAVGLMIDARTAGGAFASLEAFCDRVDRQALNKRVVETLIKAGAMDTLPGTRRQQLAVLDQVLELGIKAQRSRATGQIGMFDDVTGGATAGEIETIPLPIISESDADRKEVLGWEKELLGIAFSLDPRKEALARRDRTGLTGIGEIQQPDPIDSFVGKTLQVVGVVTTTRSITTKKGDEMLVATLEDEQEESVELVVFPRQLERVREVIVADALVRVVGKVDRRNETVQLVVESATSLDLAADPPPDAPVPASPAAPPPVAPLPPVAPPPVAEPAAILKPRSRVPAAAHDGNGNGSGNGSGSGNGHGSGNGSGHGSGGDARELLISLAAGPNDALIRTMQRIHDILRESPGEDRVRLRIPHRQHGMIVLQSRAGVHCTVALIDQLQALASVAVEPSR